MTATTLETDSRPEATATAPAPAQRGLSAEELNDHAQRIGTRPDLIKIQDITTPDFVTVIIGKPDGRSLRRVVPRECWDDPQYRASLIRDMGFMLA